MIGQINIRLLIKRIRKIARNVIVYQGKVPISRTLYSSQKCYVDEGFGGEPIEFSPIYECFHKYIHSNRESAFDDFCEWYWDQFSKYHNVSKEHGGMYLGSLYRLIKHNHQQANKEFLNMKVADLAIVDASIKQRVEQRFSLVECIIKEGYIPDLADPITAIKQDGKYVLQNGHHRACILAVLGKNYLPQVYVCKGRLITELFGPYIKTYSSFPGVN